MKWLAIAFVTLILATSAFAQDYTGCEQPMILTFHECGVSPRVVAGQSFTIDCDVTNPNDEYCDIALYFTPATSRDLGMSGSIDTTFVDPTDGAYITMPGRASENFTCSISTSPDTPRGLYKYSFTAYDMDTLAGADGFFIVQ